MLNISGNNGNAGVGVYTYKLTKPNQTKLKQVLNISGNKIGDGGIGVLCKKLRRNQHLETLDLAHNDLHEGAAEDLADMLALNASLTSVFHIRTYTHTYTHKHPHPHTHTHTRQVNVQRNKLRSAGMLIISKAPP